MTDRQKLMQKIRMADFAVIEANLFLDTHKTDRRHWLILINTVLFQKNCMKNMRKNMVRLLYRTVKLKSAGIGLTDRGHGSMQQTKKRWLKSYSAGHFAK